MTCSRGRAEYSAQIQRVVYPNGLMCVHYDKSGLTYREDIRKENPEIDRQRAFKRGWTDADKGEEFTDETLDELTWPNLGWRLGAIFGDTSDELKQELFEWCKEQQSQR